MTHDATSFVRRRGSLAAGVACGAFLTLAAACGSGGGGAVEDSGPYGLAPRSAPPALAFPLEVPAAGSARFAEAWPSLPAFTEPVFVTAAPGDAQSLYVVERTGRVLRVDADAGSATTEVFLDLSAAVGTANHEEGLIGLAFHPAFATNGVFFVRYVEAGPPPRPSRLSRYRVTGGVADPASEEVLLEIPADEQIHRGGMLAFGPDGDLYLAVGDGAEEEHAQDLHDLHGKVLRLDVDHADPGLPYAVPADNPFLGVAGARPEVWAYGFRNPWRFSFDRAGGDLFLGDVGEGLREEVDLVRRGANHGWNAFEGTLLHRDDAGPGPYAAPVLDYARPTGNCVIGGYVYRGSAIPALAGAYVYGDYGSGTVWAMTVAGGVATSNQTLDQVPDLTSFGEDGAGELLACSQSSGRVLRLVANDPAPTVPFPARLSDTGLYADLATMTPAPGLVPYDVNVPLWSDGATKERLLALPGFERIGRNRDAPWVFPTGTAIAKTFRLPSPAGVPVRVETRVLLLTLSGWQGYSYRWRDDESDADLLAGADARTLDVADPAAPGGVATRTWSFPARTDCLRCHTAAAGRVLGITTRQLNRTFAYGDVVDQQLRAWGHAGLFLDDDLPAPRDLPAHPRLGDPTALPDALARAVLDVNCSMCHRPGGPGGGSMDLRSTVDPGSMGVVWRRPVEGALGLSDPWLIHPGLHAGSVLWLRMAAAGPGRMPPLSTSVPDPAGVDLVGRWIDAQP